MIEQSKAVNDFSGDELPTAREYAETLWLALQLSTLPGEAATKAKPEAAQPPRGEPPATETKPSERERASKPPDSQGQLDIYTFPVFSNEPVEAGRTGRVFRSPAPSALRRKLEIAQALRPLKRKVPARNAIVLDEDATAHHIAEGGIWSPIMRPSPTRWLDLALIVDTGASMVIWEEAVEEFCLLLEQEAAFRDIRVWGVCTDDAEGECILHVGMRRSRRAEKHSPDLLIDPSGKRLFMVVSDCVAAGWRNGTVNRLLAKLGSSGPLAIVQVLPRRLWERTALGPLSTRLLAPAPGVPNTQLKVLEQPFEEDEARTDPVPIPVVMLESKSLGRWAKLVAGAADGAVPGIIIHGGDAAPAPNNFDPQDEMENTSGLSAEQYLQRFRSASSPTAQKLAGYLAAISRPFNLPLIRLVQRTMLPESSQMHLAEVLLGGLLRQIPSDTEAHDNTFYEFMPGVSDLLINTIRVSEVLKIRDKISRFIETNFGRARDFPTILYGSDSSDYVHMSPASAAFATISDSMLRRIGWPYEPISPLEISAQSTLRTSGLVAYPKFQESDLVDPANLVEKLRDARDPVSAYLRHMFTPEVQKGIDNYAGDQLPKGLLHALLKVLNEALNSNAIYDEGRFDDVEQAYRIRKQALLRPQGEALVRLNRLLLEAAYPSAIAASGHIYCLAEDTSNCQAMEQIRAEYERQNRVTIEFEKMELDRIDQESDESLKNWAPTYDIILQHSYKLAGYVRNNWVLDLDEIKALAPDADYSFEQSIFTNVWYESSYYPKKMDGEPCPIGYPFAANTMLLVYNRRMFEDEGKRRDYERRFGEELKVPTNWGQFKRVAEFFTSASESTHGIVMQGQEEGKWLYYEWCNFAYSMGGGVMKKKYGWEGGRDTPILIDSEATIKACEFYLSLKRLNAGTYFDIGHAEQQKLMNSGKVAMAIMWSDRLFNFINESPSNLFGFAPIPGRVSMIGAGTYFINRAAENKEQAASYIVSMMQMTNQIKLMTLGLSSALRTAYDDPRVKEIPYVDAVQESLKRGTYMLEAARDAIYIRDIVTSTIQRIWRGDVGLEPGLRAAHREIRDRQQMLWA